MLVYISNALSTYKPNSSKFTIGGVLLHEILGHIHPKGAGTWALQDFYKLRRSTNDHRDVRFGNKKIK
jgi:hypothetical protein